MTLTSKDAHPGDLRGAIRRAAPACVLVLAAGDAIHTWGQDAEALFGYDADAMRGQHVARLLPFLDEGHTEGWCTRADGSVFPCLIAVLAQDVSVGGDQVGLQRLHVIDLSAHEAGNEDRRLALEQQVLEASEQLQQQIGQDLHDGLGQLLTGTAFLAKSLQRSVAEESQPQVLRVVELVNQAISRVRSLARGLSPIHVEAQTLEGALRSIARESTELLGIECVIQHDGRVTDAQPSTVYQLSLIAREAITNAVRHGQAGRVVLRLRREDERSVMEVEDDGTGVDRSTAAADGLGIRSMGRRARIIGGTFSIAHVATGTLVRCTWLEP